MIISSPLRNIPSTKLQLVDGDGGAEHSDGTADTGIVQLDDVKVTLHHDSHILGAYGLFASGKKYVENRQDERRLAKHNG